MTAVFFSFHLFRGRSLVHKGRAHHTETSWYLAASQAMIILINQSVITLSTRDFYSQFVWLLPPIAGKAIYVIFLCDHAIITGFPSRDHV